MVLLTGKYAQAAGTYPEPLHILIVNLNNNHQSEVLELQYKIQNCFPGCSSAKKGLLIPQVSMDLPPGQSA